MHRPALKHLVFAQSVVEAGLPGAPPLFQGRGNAKPSIVEPFCPSGDRPRLPGKRPLPRVYREKVALNG
jgi:hypothetical protein